MALSLDAANYAEVFRHFISAGDEHDSTSCYAYAPVFRARIGGQAVAIKRTCGPLAAAESIAAWVRRLREQGVPVVTPCIMEAANPTVIGETAWVAYPWVKGRRYTGEPADQEAAGDLLGRIHAASAPAVAIPAFPWPDHDAASVEEDVTGLQRVLGAHAPQVRDEVLDRLAPQLESFMTDTLPAIRDADLPTAAVTMDFKANNLVYADGGPVLIDPDNGEQAVRLLDLAMAALLFHNEAETAPPRLFTADEWRRFLTGYRRHVKLTEAERRAWPTALRYMLLEWGTWTLIDADEWGDWGDPRKRMFLIDLARTDEHRFTLD